MKNVILLILLLFLIFSLNFFKYNRFDFTNSILNQKIELPSGSDITQKFPSRHNNLFRIKIMEANNPIIDNETMIKNPMLFELIDSQSNQIIRTIHFSALNISILEKLIFTFDPIPDSAGKEYYFRIKSIETDLPNSPYILTIGSSDKIMNQVYGLKSSTDIKTQGTLTFQSYYKATISQLIIDSMIDFTERLSQDKYFVVIYSGVLFLIVILYLII